MALTINTNIASMNAQRQLSNTQDQQATTFARLSSGLRINSAADDAGGLYLSQSQTKDIKGLSMATRNAGDGISLAQTAEGALDQIGSNLQRINELAIQSANDTYNDEAREGLQKEVDQLTQEINRIVETTEFNGRKLLSKDSESLNLQIGFRNDSGSIINTGLEGGLVSQGEGSFSFSGTNRSFETKAQAQGVAQLQLAANIVKDGFDTSKLIDGTATKYTGVTLADLSTDAGATDSSKALHDAIAGLGNGDSATVGDLTVRRVASGATDKLGIDLEIEFNGNTTTVAGAYTGGAYDKTKTIADTNMNDLFGTAASVTDSYNSALANDVFGDKAFAYADKASNVTVADLEAFDSGKLNDLKDGDKVTVGDVTYARSGTDLVLSSEFGSKDATVVGVWSSKTIVGGIDATKTLGDGDLVTLFDRGSQEVNSMASMLDGDLKGTKQVDISNADSAREAIEFTRNAIDTVSSLRATFGAAQNRFDAVISNNDTYGENLSAARSRLRDADFAGETARLAQLQTLQQAGISVLGQANASSQAALSLLR